MTLTNLKKEANENLNKHVLSIKGDEDVWTVKGSIWEAIEQEIAKAYEAGQTEGYRRGYENGYDSRESEIRELKDQIQ